MRANTMSLGKRVLSRAALLAPATVLCLASASSMAAIIDSGPISLSVPATLDGLYINVATGATGGTGGATPGWDFNPFLTGGNLGIFWAPAPAGGVGTTAATGPLIVLGPGSTIDSSALFTRAIAAASTLRPTQDAYFGFQFTNEGTGAVNFGYARFTSTGPTGFPFTITRLVFENAGAPITIPAGTTAPIFAYTPPAASTVSFTGGTTIGSTGNASIAVAIGTPGVGTGAAATTTTTCTAPTAPFAGFGQTVTAEGAGAITGSPLTGTCTLGAAVATQTLTCSENRGGTPTAVTFTLSCPAGTQPPLTSTPASGSTITLPPFTLGGAATTAPLQFENPGTIAATVTCVAPTATEFTVAPLSIPVPAGGNASTTISFSSAAAGPFTGTLNCSAGAQNFTYSLSGTAAATPLTSTPASGSTITLPAFTLGGAATTAPLAFQNPGLVAATVTCTAPAATQFTVAPLSIPVAAGGSASTTISFSSAVAGPFAGTLNCTAGAQTFTYSLSGTASATPLTSTPVSGGTLTLPTFTIGGAPTSGAVTFQNPGLVAATVTCTAPTATQFTAAPLTIAVPAGGSGSTTVSFTTAVAGTFTGTLNCTSGAQTFTINLSAGGSAQLVAVPTLDHWGRLLLALLALGVAVPVLLSRRS